MADFGQSAGYGAPPPQGGYYPPPPNQQFAQPAYGAPSYAPPPPQYGFPQPTGMPQPVYGQPAMAPEFAQPAPNAYAPQPHSYAQQGPPGPGAIAGSAHSFQEITPSLTSGRRDTCAAVAFWIHVLVIVIIAFAAGVPAIQRANSAGDGTQHDTFDFNASLFVRMLILGCTIGGIASALLFFVLQRFGGALIKISLYSSLVIQLILAIAMFTIAVPMGVIMLLVAAFTACYIWWVRDRIEFAAAHLQCACDAVNTYKSVFGVAVIMLLVQTLWVLFWGMAAFGLASSINASQGNNAAANGGKSNGNASGGLIVFVLLISLYWGAQVFTNVVHFVVACTVGHWWFSPTPSNVVRGSLYRAFTDSFGSIALGSLIVAVLRAAYVMAKNAEERAQRRGDSTGAFLACCAACLLRCVADAVEYFNKWAYIYCALTGDDFRSAGSAAWKLFASRGWTAVINDDLAGDAISLVCIMAGALSAVIGAGFGAAAMGTAKNGTYIGVAAFFCFFAGLAMATVMGAVLKSAVRTVFVCFAMNPTALQATHPASLQRLVAAWNKFHPQVFHSCGYSSAFGSSAVVASA